MMRKRKRVKLFLFSTFFLSSYALMNILFQRLNTSTEWFDDRRLLELQQTQEQEARSISYDGGVVLPKQEAEIQKQEVEFFSASTLNVTCKEDRLGMTEYARDICVKESEEMCQLLTCRNLLTGSGNDLYYGHAKTLMKLHPRMSLPDSSFLNETSNCELFKRLRGYRMKAINRDEEEFPIAFNILAHMGAEQVERLLRSLYRPQNVYCIHVDAKSPESFRDALRSIASCFDNVHLASESERIVYAGYSRLQADITCMKDNLNTGVQWKYLINTASQAYPLRTVSEMVRILKIYNGANDIEGIYGKDVIRVRYEREWVEDLNANEVIRSGRMNPRPPHNIDIVRGSAYGIFSRKFVEFILSDSKAIDLLTWSRNTFSPDEHYWATLHHTFSNPQLHTPGGFSGNPNNKPWLAVYANWDAATCLGKMVHDVCVFGLGDLPLLAQRKEFFVNKFHQDFEPLALDCLEAWIRHRDDCPSPIDEEFYRELPFIKH